MSRLVDAIAAAIVVGVVAAPAALCGCGGGSASSPTDGDADAAGDARTGADGTTPEPLAGTVGGRAFVVRDALIATTLDWASAFAPGSSTVLLLSDAPALCDQIITSNRTPRNSQLLVVNLAEPAQAMARPITAPGDFPIADDLTRARVASAHLAYVDTDCTFDDSSAISGSVGIAALDAGGASGRGSLSLVLQGGTLAGSGMLSGTFAIGGTCATAAVDEYLNQVPACP